MAESFVGVWSIVCARFITNIDSKSEKEEKRLMCTYNLRLFYGTYFINIYITWNNLNLHKDEKQE